MDRSSLTDQEITITPNIVFTVQLSNDNMTVKLIPKAKLDYSTTYSVTLSTGIRSLRELHLTESYTFNFTTESEPQIKKIAEEDDDKYNIDFASVGIILLIAVILVFIVLMYVSFRNRYMTPPGEEITEEIGGRVACPECGGLVDPADKICSECGFKLRKRDFKVGCPKCGTPMEVEDKKCPSCGFKEKKRTKPVKKEDEDDEEQEKCPFCGAEVEEDAGSCPVCGEVFDEEDSDFVCGKCGASVDPGEVLCPFCGESFFKDEMVCSECGAMVKGDDSFCPECGEVFDDDVDIEIEEDD